MHKVLYVGVLGVCKGYVGCIGVILGVYFENQLVIENMVFAKRTGSDLQMSLFSRKARSALK